MKLRIKVKVLTEGCMPEINNVGECIDLKSAVSLDLPAPQSSTLRRVTINGEECSFRDVTMNTYYIPLGIAVELPKGFEATILSRSSSPKKLGLAVPHGMGLVDNSYCGEEDEWKYVCTTMRTTSIEKGDKICQFRIRLSQKATIWQKLKWLFSSGVKLVEVDSLSSKNRGGLGSTGIK